MGDVYKGVDTRLGRTVAIRVLPGGAAADTERRRRFEQEARAVSALNHPHICVLHDIGSQDGPGLTPGSTAGMVMGTLPYIAPEQLQGGRADARSDLFAFGTLLCELLTGTRTFEGTSPAGVIAAGSAASARTAAGQNGPVGPAPPRVCAGDALETEVLRSAIARAPTVARLVAELEGTDPIVIIETDRLPEHIAGQVRVAAATASVRYVRVRLKIPGSEASLMKTLGQPRVA
jgi:serine/threonine protein kinase